LRRSRPLRAARGSTPPHTAPGAAFVVLLVAIFVAFLAKAEFVPAPAARADAERDPLKQPFSSTSIWNMPIGADATYVPARIPPVTQGPLTVDPDILILAQNAPLTGVYQNDDGWSGGDRCTPGAYLYSVPIPSDYVVPGASPASTPNNAAAILLPDGRTVRQPQPLARCSAGGPATALVTYPDVDIYGDGIAGAHGGSGLSSIGGTIRLGEFVPGGGIHHAIKINLYGSTTLSPSSGGYRWPASKADLCAATCYGGSVPELRMGSLLALPPDVDIDTMGLRTEAAKMLAWTLQNYGGYVVDDTGWSVYAIEVEHSPEGQVEDEFQSRWGFGLESSGHTPWGHDMDLLFGALAVVDNNSPSSIGGGGTPRQPLAPPLDEPYSPDTDGDGYSDGQEVALGKDPLAYCYIMRADVDGDGIVSTVDFSLVAAYFLQYIPPAPGRYDQAPLPFDRIITIIDLANMASEFLQNVTACP
jgi:hypothetical protein